MTSKAIEKKIFIRIKNVIRKSTALIHKPLFLGNEKKYLSECINSSYVSSSQGGKFIDKFEKKLKKITNSPNIISVINATSGLQIALKLSGVKKNDEVLVPALTFVGTCNAIKYLDAVPHFVDSDIFKYGIDFKKLDIYLSNITKIKSNTCYNRKTGKKISAIIVVHLFGHPANLSEAIKISKKYKLKLIEDAAESIGSFYKKKHTGTFGIFGVLSFNGNKSITTGGGGALITRSAKLAKDARHLVNVSKLKHKFKLKHDKIGYNFSMPNLNAALGLAQVENLKKIISLKRKLYLKYQNSFKDMQDVTILKEPKNNYSNYWLQTLILKKYSSKILNKILKYINSKGIQVRPSWDLISDMNVYKNCPRMNLDGSKIIRDSIINLPSSPEIALENA